MSHLPVRICYGYYWAVDDLVLSWLRIVLFIMEEDATEVLLLGRCSIVDRLVRWSAGIVPSKIIISPCISNACSSLLSSEACFSIIGSNIVNLVVSVSLCRDRFKLEV